MFLYSSQVSSSRGLGTSVFTAAVEAEKVFVDFEDFVEALVDEADAVVFVKEDLVVEDAAAEVEEAEGATDEDAAEDAEAAEETAEELEEEVDPEDEPSKHPISREYLR